jgi:hypothetical protein
MKKLTVLIVVLIAFTGFANAQKSKLIGSWLITKVEVNARVEKPYQFTGFSEDGKMIMMGMDVGTWSYNKSINTIDMESGFDKDFNGAYKIDKLDGKTLIMTKEGIKIFYTKIDETKIAAANKNSGLMGMWEFKNVPYSDATTLVTFAEPDEFTMIQKEEGMRANLSGTWIFDKQNTALIMIGLRSEDTFNGENMVFKINEENLELENNGTVFKGNKKAQNTIKIERLSFNEGDFYTEDGDYKYYGEEEKLPWRNWSKMKTGLLNIKQLVYNYSTLISGTEAFETKTLTADVKATLEEEGFIIDNIFNGYDRYNLPEDAEFYNNTDYSTPLYPLEDDVYRIVGNEEITTPAGTFDCTVLEGVNDSGALNKIWLINDKIGVYAKIIEDDPDETWGHYHVYELQAIK